MADPCTKSEVVTCLERGADLHMAQLIPLPLTVSCSSKIQIGFTFLVLAHLGSPGQRAVKRCVCVFVRVSCQVFTARFLAGFALKIPMSSHTWAPKTNRFFCGIYPGIQTLSAVLLAVVWVTGRAMNLQNPPTIVTEGSLSTRSTSKKEGSVTN